jgi:hypothetical protein
VVIAPNPTVPTWNPVFPNGRFSRVPGDGLLADAEAFGGIPGSVVPTATPAAAPIIRRKSLRVVLDRILRSSFRQRRTRTGDVQVQWRIRTG